MNEAYAFHRPSPAFAGGLGERLSSSMIAPWTPSGVRSVPAEPRSGAIRPMSNSACGLRLAARNRRRDGFKIRRQATIGPFIVDFLCIEAMSVIELDGGQHEVDGDARRTSFLEDRGYRILRFWNKT